MQARSQQLFEKSKSIIPGGVNSPVRSFKSVGGQPRFIRSAEGPFLFDEDGKKYIDYVGSWGPMILGHRSEVVEGAIAGQLRNGISFGAPTEGELHLAERLVDLVPSVEMVRLLNSGTEATMTAVRIARAASKRDLIIKFSGCYHGHADAFLVEAGSGVASCGIAGSPGVPQAVAAATLSVEYNNVDALRQCLNGVGPERVAAIIVEPVAGNMGLVLPRGGFLEEIRSLCDQHKIVLIFDEVMSGFRVALGGAQERYQVLPDLSTLGKVIGGGLPVGAVGGKKELMSQLAPHGPVYQAGTLSGNPLATAAGVAVLDELRNTNPYPFFERLGRAWADGFEQAARSAGIPLQTRTCGAMLGLFFSDKPDAINNFDDVQNTDRAMFNRFFHAMLDEGVYLAPSAFEACFLSTAHSDEVLDQTFEAARRAFMRISG